ncbi:MAG: hypothetical protein HYU51_14260 [Candidatus Rokubacteria bacterium]|nr:hypothetical protein [Candidatus Rokubacteria bacterium]
MTLTSEEKDLAVAASAKRVPENGERAIAYTAARRSHITSRTEAAAQQMQRERPG